MIQDQARRLEALADFYKVPQADTVNRALYQLDRMSGFYKQKSLNAPPRQAAMFNDFIAALSFAAKQIQAHEELTTVIAEVVKKGRPQ